MKNEINNSNLFPRGGVKERLKYCGLVDGTQRLEWWNYHERKMSLFSLFMLSTRIE